MESTLQKISRKTGKKMSQCKCQLCKKQCQVSPCLGTPDDIGRIISAGYKDQLAITEWAAGIMMGVTNEVILVVAPLFDRAKGACTFYENGLCTLHDRGLKPTEGKLSHHTTSVSNFDPKKSLAWAVAKEWWGMTETEVEAMLK
jgi:hypothetical protein